MSSSLHRHRYVSWCEDSAGPPTPVTTAPASPGVPHLNHQPAGSGSIPLLLLTSPETRRGPQPTVTHSHQPPLDTAPDNHDEGEDEGGEDRSLVLPRSSPVVSTRHRPVSWHGGGIGPSDPPSLDRPSPASGSLPLAQRLTVTSVEDLGCRLSSCPSPSRLQEDRTPRCVSVSSNLSQQGLAEEHRGRGLPSCDAPTSSGLCTSVSEDRGSSGYPEFSAGIFKSSCELEKENAHFIVVDMVLEVLEGVKWTLMDTQRHVEGEPPHEHRQACETCTHTQTCSDQQDKHTHSDEDVKRPQRNTHSSVHTHQHTQDKEEEEAGYDEDEHPTKTLSVLSTDSGFSEDSGGDTTSTLSAEQLAQQLVLQFRSRWLPSLGPRRGRRSLRSSLQELPGGVTVSSSLAEEIRLRTRMRGSLSWAPPRFQIIFTVQPAHRRSEVVALQHFLCAGCGTEVEPKFIRKLRYCEYLGRYFCDCCHSGSEAVIPGRLLSCWDFGRYPVSDFSKQLLDSVWHQPLFDLTCVGKTLYSRVKELDKFRELQDQLLCIKKLLTACRLSEGVKAEFEQLPAHLLEQPHLFSMEDLLRVKRGQLAAQAKAVLHSAVHHVENCELCLARGFICELCREGGVLFPFQSDVCSRCAVCRTCFHKHCFVEKKCPKCSRIQSRKNVQMDP